jgi:membrane protease YdiL (CAAX protease family)
MDKQTIRNVVVFIIIVLLSGWLGYLVDQNIDPQPEGETLGMGIWLVFPFVTMLLLRQFAGDGWKDIGLRPHFSGHIPWYLLALVIYPLVTSFVVILGNALGWLSLAGFDKQAYLTGLFAALLPNFIKNIFEEIVWRGYLTAKLIKLRLHDLWIYLIVGGVWGAWHFPYYLYFLPSTVLEQVLPVDKVPFALFAIFTMICWSIMYVELYRIVKSIWPVVLLHMVEDATVNHLIMDEHVVVEAGKEIFISPISGLITSAVYVIIGLSLRQRRLSLSKGL